jgi:hypothetical protein
MTGDAVGAPFVPRRHDMWDRLREGGRAGHAVAAAAIAVAAVAL